MVYTVTFNPAIDYVLHIDSLIPNSIIRSKSEEIFFGGKGINVSLILGELGIKSTSLGFVAGFTGEAIEKGIATDYVSADFVKLLKGNSRINVKIRSGEETDINAGGPEISVGDIEKLFKKLDRLENGDFIVLAGSIPSGVPRDIYEKIMEHLQEKQVKIIVDAEGELLLNSLKYKPFLIKPNREELSAIFNVDVRSHDDAIIYAAQLKKMGAQNVVVSLGGDGAVLLAENGETYRQNALGGKPINTVGAGDSLVAGFIAGYIKSGDFAYALRLAAAAGGATACSNGLATKTQIEELMK